MSHHTLLYASLVLQNVSTCNFSMHPGYTVSKVRVWPIFVIHVVDIITRVKWISCESQKWINYRHKSILHRDANLWKSKTWRLSLWHLLYEVFHEVQTITIRSYDCNGEIIFVIDEICAKMPQKLNYESEKIQILGENGIISKLKHRKAHN